MFLNIEMLIYYINEHFNIQESQKPAFWDLQTSIEMLFAKILHVSFFLNCLAWPRWVLLKESKVV